MIDTTGMRTPRNEVELAARLHEIGWFYTTKEKHHNIYHGKKNAIIGVTVFTGPASCLHYVL